ncbi:hypothetical protein LINGRAHAP2_LOCUS30839 [Linum grandiflorum]
MDVDGTSRKAKCKFCLKVYSGGIFRLKHHLAGTRDNVDACLSTPNDVRKKMLELLDFNLEAKEVRKNLMSSTIPSSVGSASNSFDVTSDRRIDLSSSSRSLLTRTQTTVSQLLKKDLRREACKGIAHWFYTTASSFNGTRCEAYNRMFDLVARHGPGFKPPSYHEVRETFLKEEKKEVDEKLCQFRDEWKHVGCTLMSNGWTDIKRRSICNFLANSPKGTVFIDSIDTSDFSKNTEKVFEMLDNVVEKVGEDKVIQIVTDNASAYKAAGKRLMEKRKHLYWTPCAAHCLDLMLEDFDKRLNVHKATIEKAKKITNYIYASTLLISMLREFTKGYDLIRPGATRFATTYLTLACLSQHKGSLLAMFSSDTWKKSTFSSKLKGRGIQGIVLDPQFWRNVTTCIRGALPLVSLLRLVDSEDSPSMPFLFFELKNAKEKIKSNFKHDETR